VSVPESKVMPRGGSPTRSIRPPDDIRKILVVDLGFLGDSVHLVPALWEIRSRYPPAALHTVSAPLGAELLGLVPCVDRAWAFPLGPKSPPWWRHWDVVGALRRERFDAAFNFSGADRTIFLTALSGARWRLAHAAGRQHFWNRWLIHNWVPRQNSEVPVFEQRRRVLAACGFDLAPARFDLRVPETARSWAAEHVPMDSVHVSITASGWHKEWPLSEWIELGRRLLDQAPALQLVATAGATPRERQRLGEFAAVLNSKRVMCFCGLPLARLAALLGRCRLHVGVDSGVLHLAFALAVPTLSLFRQYAGLTEWRPPGPQHQVLTVPCPCADQRTKPCAGSQIASCLAGITPALVARVALDQLAHWGRTSR
jgi:ADP-heptose:LPS heptosyltransferase